MTPPEISGFRLNASGIRRVLGDLEADVMEVIWEAGHASVNEVRHRLRGDRTPAFNTVMTVMNRLVQKGVLTKAKRGRRFIYESVRDRVAFLEAVSGAVVRGLIEDFGDLAVNQFSTALAGEDPDRIAELEELVAGWKSKRE